MLKLAEVATACGISVKTVQRWIAFEQLPCVRLRGAGVREMAFVRPGDLEAWLLRSRTDPAVTTAAVPSFSLEGQKHIVRGKKKSNPRT